MACKKLESDAVIEKQVRVGKYSIFSDVKQKKEANQYISSQHPGMFSFLITGYRISVLFLVNFLLFD